MATLTIIRPKARFGQWRNLQVYVDGLNVGHVGSGNTVSFDVNAGVHDVYVKMDWYYSPVLSINILAEETIALQCGEPNVDNKYVAYLQMLRSVMDRDNFFSLDYV